MTAQSVPTQEQIAQRLGLPVHPPKVETFDLEPRTNTDSKQQVRAVDTYRVESFGLYMARPIVDHPKLRYVESWLLPDFGIRVSDFRWRAGQERNQDFYLDVVNIEPGPDCWRTVDLYLDIVVATGQFARVIDTDEFVTALRADLLTPETAQQAMDTTHAVVDGLAQHDYDLDAWLLGGGIELTWAARPTTR